MFWGDITHGNQKAYFERARQASPMHFKRTRWDIVLQGLGDAAAYIRTRTVDGAAYHRIQDRISLALDQLDVPEYGNRPLVFIGHSLGCQIISSYVWDTNRLKQNSPPEGEPDLIKLHDRLQVATPFRRLDTLAGIITLGSNIPLFTFAFDPRRVIPISRPRARGEQPAFPGSALPPEIAARARWLNFFSPFDVLGFPLKPLNPSYDQTILADRAVLSGGLSFFHPIRAHEGYWRTRRVITETANLLGGLID